MNIWGHGWKLLFFATPKTKHFCNSIPSPATAFLRAIFSLINFVPLFPTLTIEMDMLQILLAVHDGFSTFGCVFIHLVAESDTMMWIKPRCLYIKLPLLPFAFFSIMNNEKRIPQPVDTDPSFTRDHPRTLAITRTDTRNHPGGRA